MIAYLIPLLVNSALAEDVYRLGYKHRVQSPTPPSMGPMTHWDIEHYTLNVWLNPDDQTVEATTTIRATALTDHPNQIRLHAKGPLVHSVSSDSGELPFTQSVPFVIADVPATTPAGTSREFAFEYTVTDFDADTFIGLNWGDPIHTFHEPRGARTWLVLYDDPADLATLRWEIRVPDDLTVIANGTPEPILDLGDGTALHAFNFDQPIATYLMVLHAGTYSHHVDTSGSVPVHTWAKPDLFETAKSDFANSATIIDQFAGLFGPYPWTHYANVTAPFSGAMEHTTATTFGESLIGEERAEVINAHEIAHHWFGNYVTPVEWPEIWLNEGFASYGEVLWTERKDGLNPAAAYRDAQIESYFAWQAFEGTSSLYDPAFMWGGLVYDKGSMVVHMLRQTVGDPAFFAGLSDYIATHAHGNVSTADLQAAVEVHHGQPLDWFFEQWVYQAGDPSYRWGITQSELGTDVWQVDVHVIQEAPGSWETRIPLEFQMISGATMRAHAPSNDGTVTASFCLAEPIDTVDFDPDSDVLFFQDIRVDSIFEPLEDICSPDVPQSTDDDTAAPTDTGSGKAKAKGSGPACGCAQTPHPGPFGAIVAFAVAFTLGRRRPDQQS